MRTHSRLLWAVTLVSALTGCAPTSNGTQPPASVEPSATVGSASPSEPMRNGRIVEAGYDGFWLEDAAPPPPDADLAYIWQAFEQDAGWFLYTNAVSPEGRLWVVGEDGLVAELVCPASLNCGRDEMATFAPGPDEVTWTSADGRSAHVIGFDGMLRDTLDISVVLAQRQKLSDLAWSPDGNRLAVSTEFEVSTECDSGIGPCGVAWILDRDTSEAQLVYVARGRREREVMSPSVGRSRECHVS